MKKRIALSLLIVSSTFVHAMENDSSFLSSFSPGSFLSTWFSSNQKPKESQLVSDIRANKNEFEDKLRDKEVKRLLKNEKYMTIFPFSAYNITSTPIKFLQYCYYQKFHENMFNMHLDDLDVPLLEKCHEVRLNGYSALGAAIISDDTSIEEKHNFIQKLINLAFLPTSKDIGLAELILYDEIATHKKRFLHLLQALPEVNWSILSHDIRKNIAHYMVELFKKEFWLLPETTLNDF